MKRNIKQYLIAATATLLLAACEVKDPIYNTPHPDQGAVTLTTDWSHIGTGLTAPDAYTVTTGAGYSASLTGATNRLDQLFPPGTYHFLVYNTPAHITVAGTTATVEEASGNVDGADRFINNAPGWLFTGTADAAIEQDSEQSLTVAMQQQVRELTLIINPTGGTPERIEGIDGYLSGVASTLDIATGTHTGPLNVELPFTMITEGADAGKWSATVRLLGIAGTGQELNATIRFTGGTPSPVPFNTILTEQLAGFNDDKKTPLVLGGKVVETPTETGFTATIIDWEKVTGKPGTAD